MSCKTNNEKFKVAKRANKAEFLMKQDKFIKETMKKMEEYAYTKEEAEAFTEALAKAVKRNNERLIQEKPFVIGK